MRRVQPYGSFMLERIHAGFLNFCNLQVHFLFIEIVQGLILNPEGTTTTRIAPLPPSAPKVSPDRAQSQCRERS